MERKGRSEDLRIAQNVGLRSHTFDSRHGFDCTEIEVNILTRNSTKGGVDC